MFKSIRWTLQLWHAGILLLALSAFGAALYIAADRTAYTEVDHELLAAARVFAALQIPPQLMPSPSNPGDMKWAVAEAPKGSPGSGGSVVTDVAPSDLPMPATASRISNSEKLRVWVQHVPADCLHRIGWDERDQPYFVVWAPDGSIIRHSIACPDVPLPIVLKTVSSSTSSQSSHNPPEIRQRDNMREVALPGPLGSTILIGRSVEREEAGLQSLRLSLAGVGAVVLLVGLLGGFLLSDRAIRPIRLISSTARSISASDFSKRIDTHQTKSEFGPLAETLNETFDRLEGAFVRERQFTADASHELRTPLAVIHAQSELALTKNRTPEEYRQTIEASLRASTRMKSLIESLLLLARADSGSTELHLERFDVRQAAEECVELLAPLAQKRNISLDCQGKSVEIEADRGCILQLITNLVSNAIQYNRPGGSVSVKIKKELEFLVLQIEDTGLGIETSDQPKVFQRFFRADNARSRESGGSGLGLAICQSIVAAHGGTISFSSKIGLGTIFSVHLPILSADSHERDIRSSET